MASTDFQPVTDARLNELRQLQARNEECVLALRAGLNSQIDMLIEDATHGNDRGLKHLRSLETSFNNFNFELRNWLQTNCRIGVRVKQLRSGEA